MKINKKQINKLILFASILWAACYLIALNVIKEYTLSNEIKVLLSILPTITFGILIYFYITSINLMDEVEKRIHLETAVFAFSTGLALIMTIGIVDTAFDLNKEIFGTKKIFIYLFILYFIGVALSKNKYLFKK